MYICIYIYISSVILVYKQGAKMLMKVHISVLKVRASMSL